MACSVALAELASDSSRFKDTATNKHRQLKFEAKERQQRGEKATKKTAVKVDPLHYTYLETQMVE